MPDVPPPPPRLATHQRSHAKRVTLATTHGFQRAMHQTNFDDHQSVGSVRPQVTAHPAQKAVNLRANAEEEEKAAVTGLILAAHGHRVPSEMI